MSAENLERYEVFLMINQETAVLYPLSSHALHFAQGALNSVVGRCRHDLMLDSNGSIFRIAGMRPVNDGVADKLKRLAGFPYAIETERETLVPELDIFKALLLRGLRDYASKLDGDDSWDFVVQPFSEIETAVLSAKDTKSLYKTLAPPNAVYCLDLL